LAPLGCSSIPVVTYRGAAPKISTKDSQFTEYWLYWRRKKARVRASRKTRPIFEREHKRPQRIFARLMGGAWMRARTQRNEIDRKPLITQETAKRLIQRSQCFQRLKGSPAKRFISLRETKSLYAQPERRARKSRKSALKPLKSFARVTLCAAAPFKIALALAKRAAPPLPARRFAGKPGAPRQFSV
jgi:hypothetical protein